jgi:hypothetical protein
MDMPPNWGFFKPNCKDLKLNSATITRKHREAEIAKEEPLDMDIHELKGHYYNRDDWKPEKN